MESTKIKQDPGNATAYTAELERVDQRDRLPECLQSKSADEIRQLEKHMVRKVDARLMPSLIIMYLLNYIDRSNIASARLGGLEEDLNLKGSQYQTFPSNLLLNRIGKPSLYLPGVMAVWGVVSGATGGVTSFGGLLACRFFLGFVEAPYFPGCLFYLSSWYTRKELALRTALLYSGATIAGAFSGLLGAGVIGGMDGVRGLGAWRWLFIIEGAVTVALAVPAIFILPDFPKNTKWLSEEEQAYAVWRLQEEAGQKDTDTSDVQGFWSGLLLAVRDIKTWVLMLLIFFLTYAAAVTNFFPSVVETLGYSKVTSLFLTVPPYALATITACANAWHSDRTGERYFHIVVPLFLAVAGFIVAATTTGVAPRYVSMMLMLSGIYPGYVIALGWISNTITRPPAKRAAAIALVTAFGNTGNIYASYMYQSSMAPRYILAMSIDTGFVLLGVASATLLQFIIHRENKTIEKVQEVQQEQADHGKKAKVMT